MTKAGKQMIEGLKEAITMKKLMDENGLLRSENEVLRKALTAILNDLSEGNPMRMTFEVSHKVVSEAEAALNDNV